MPTNAVDVLCRFYELANKGDAACWSLWDEEAVSVAPPEFPESGEVTGVDEIRRFFGSWRNVFGSHWFEGIRLEDVTELPDGRLLAEITFELAGERSGTPVAQPAGAIYTVRDGTIVRAEHFMERDSARTAAGLE
jgi:ketosteroid isomerase-like protein